MPLPTLSLRAAPEHHRLIRDITAALRTRPELADVLRDVLQAQHETADRMTERDTGVLQALRDHLAEVEQRVAALEATREPRRRNDTPAAPRVPLRPATPRPKERPGLRVPEEVQQRIRELRAQGMTREAISKELNVSAGAVSKYWKLPAE
jgi:hypothetical protein